MNLFLRNVLWTVLCPGTVTVLLPCLFFRTPAWEVISWNWPHWMGILLVLSGAALLLRCIFAFALEGKGTLSPVDPARKLVVKGLYVYVRNPMYVAVMVILLGEALFFASIPLSWYAGIVFLIFNVFIILYEEPYLRKQFGAEYEQYCQKTGRWLPTLRRK